MRILLFITLFFGWLPFAGAQTSQTVVSGGTTTPINFPVTDCDYNWVNDKPGVGLAASGTGNIASFTAVNNGTSPVTATIMGSPTSSGNAYIANSQSNNVSVISTITNAVIATIPVGANPYGVSASPDGSRVYVTNKFSGNVSVINTVTNSVVATIPVGNYPTSSIVSPDGSTLYVVNNNDATVSVIKTADYSLITTLTVFLLPYAALLSPDGSRLYVANEGAIRVINTAGYQEVTNITVNNRGMVLSPDGNRIYVLNNNGIQVIDTKTFAVTATIATPLPVCMAISPDGSRLYVTTNDNQDGRLQVISTVSNSVISTKILEPYPFGVSVTADGKFVYVVNYIADPGPYGDVAVINTANNTIVANVSVMDIPYTFGNFIASCPPVKYTITVNPPPLLPPAITTSLATGNISACEGMASVSPQIQQFTVSGSNLTTGITAAAPNGFEVSLSVGSGYGNTLTIPQTGGTVSNTVVYVRSSAAAAVGNQVAKISLASPGAASQDVAVAATINALPAVNAVADQTVNNGGATTSVSFTGTANTFTWVNDTPGIGLAAGGAGDIGSFNAINKGTKPVTAKITVTPHVAGLAYITSLQSGDVSVVNSLTNTVTSVITVGKDPYGTAMSPDGTLLYVSNFLDATVSVINTLTNKVVAVMTVGVYPQGVAVSPDGTMVYVANSGDNSVSVISTASNSVKGTIQSISGASGVAVSPDGSKVYVTCSTSNSVLVIDAATNNVMTTIKAGENPNGIVFSPDGTRAYITNYDSFTVSVINTITQKVIATINVDPPPFGIAISPDGSRVYVASLDEGISVINATTNTVIARVIVGSTPAGISISPDGSLLYVVNRLDNTLSIITTTNNLVVATVPVGNQPYSFGNFAKAASNCTGTPITFTITVNPSGPPPAITAGMATGNITACQGTASVSPQIQQFTVSGVNLTAGITATAPSGFEVSLSATGSYGNSIITPQTAGSVSNTMVYVRSSAAAAAGNQAAKVSLTSAGATGANIAVAATINASPIVNAVPNQAVTNGDAATAINFTGTGNAFTWINDTPGIGLPASGSGNIASFTAVNTGSSQVKATVTVTLIVAGFAYISNDVNGTVSVINTITNAVVDNIIVDAGPNGTAISPDGGTVYVTNDRSLTVSVINTFTNKVVKSIPIGQAPAGIAISPDGTTLYAANYGDNSVSVINTASKTVTATIPSIPGAFGVAISPDGSKVYVTCRASASVAVIDAATNSVTATLGAGFNPHGISVSPDGSRAYVANFDSNTVSVINTGTGAEVSAINVGMGPFGITINADGSRLYVANKNSNNVSVINTATNTVTATIAVGVAPVGASVTEDGNLLFVTNGASNTASVISTANNTVLATVPVGTSPSSFGSFIKNASNCSGQPASFTITVNPAPATAAVITATGSPSSVTTVYGTPSSSTGFTVSGSDMPAGILVTPPTGFEVSTDNVTFSATATVGAAGTIPPAMVYIRLAQTTDVGTYSGNIVLTSRSATNVNVAMPGSAVTPAALAIYANNAAKIYGAVLPGSGNGSTKFSSTGLQNSENIGTVTISYGNGAAAADGAATYTGAISAASATGGTFKAGNYTITYLPANIIVAPAALTIKADDKIKTYGDPNPILTAGYSGFVNNDGPAQLTTAPVLITPAVTSSPVGQYPITVSGAVSPNYTINYLPGTLTVKLTALDIIIPNAFTPNGDGINDTWSIKNLDFFPNCTVYIFTRWGQKVYSSIGYGIPWRGAYNGNALPNGTYYYIIDLKSGNKLLSGFVVIVK